MGQISSKQIAEGLYDRRLLRPFFAPKRIAVFGAGDDEGSVGGAVLRNLLVYPGEIYPINPKRAGRRVQGRRAYADLRSLPACPDLAVIGTRAVEESVEQCIRHKCLCVAAIPAGFAEIGAKGAAREIALFERAGQHGVTILGPNCLGLIVPGKLLNPSFARRMPRSGQITMISNSGALGTAFLDFFEMLGLGFRAFISIGNSRNLGFARLIDYFAFDRSTKVIACYVEGAARSRDEAELLFSATRLAVARGKLLVFAKAGQTEVGGQAAFSHSASMAGSYATFRAAMEAAGGLVVEDDEELLQVLQAASQPLPQGNVFSIISNAGGPLVITQDKAHTNGLKPHRLTSSCEARLRAALPEAASIYPGVDALGDAGAKRYDDAFAATFGDSEDDRPDIGIGLVTPQSMTKTVCIAKTIAKYSAKGVPLYACLMGAIGDMQKASCYLRHRGIPVFAHPGQAIRVARRMLEMRSLIDEALSSCKEECDSIFPEPDMAPAERLYFAWRQTGRKDFSGPDANELVRCLGVPMIPLFVAASAAETGTIAAGIGGPVAVKVEAEGITHKGRVGGVITDAFGALEASRAYDEIAVTVAERCGWFPGEVTVQQMAPRGAVELILSIISDELFGPMVMLGKGGSSTEDIKDRTFARPPFGLETARRMIGSLFVSKELKRFGEEAANKVAHLLVRFGRIAGMCRWIRELEVNPLCVTAELVTGVDCRVLPARDVV